MHHYIWCRSYLHFLNCFSFICFSFFLVWTRFRFPLLISHSDIHFHEKFSDAYFACLTIVITCFWIYMTNTYSNIQIVCKFMNNSVLQGKIFVFTSILFHQFWKLKEWRHLKDPKTTVYSSNRTSFVPSFLLLWYWYESYVYTIRPQKNLAY